MDEKKIRINKWDWILVVGLCLAPMTGLRTWKIGPAELLCFIWSLRYLPKRIYRVNNIAKFFAAFLSAMLIGTFIGSIVAPKELIITDWFTWFFLSFIALALYEGLKKNDIEYNEKLFNIFCFISLFWYMFLYFFSIYVSRFFLGAPLWYNNIRYTGGGLNPHQVAVLMCGLTFCFVRNIVRKKMILLNAFGVIGAFFIEWQTASSTGIASIFVGWITLIMVLTFYKKDSVSDKAIILVLELLIGVVILIVGYPILYKYFYNWLSSDPNGIGRLELFTQIGTTFRKSPLFGLGPGMHALWGMDTKEFHNTYLEIIAASGIIGFLAFLIFTIRTIRNLLSDATLLPVLIAIYGYGLAGFAMRRLAYWGIFVFIYVIAEQMTAKKVDVVMKFDRRG